LSPLLSLAALALIFWGSLQLDRPVLHAMRSLHLLWLERTGDFFHNLGSGWGLVAISALFLAAGYLGRQQPLRVVGVETLIAHGAAALVAQTAKHLIGRPRPRLLREEDFVTGPSLETGLDSFPSGHATASFAIATVVAWRCPRWGGAAYGLAGAIALSRVVRGSHYVTDVMAGLVVGTLVGAVVAGARKDWRASLADAVMSLTPYVAGAFAILWTLCRPPADAELQAMMFWTGSIIVAFGAGSRWGSAYRGEANAFRPFAAPLIAVGLALTTSAWIVVVVVVLVLCAHWLTRHSSIAAGEIAAGSRAILAEAALTVFLILTVASIQSLKGVLAQG
jgi:membrane-associated phospholipid phosphatase